MGGPGPARPDWYVMLFPAAAERDRLVARLETLAAALGGAANPDPHVTIAYFVGVATPGAVGAALDTVRVAPAALETAGLVSFDQRRHPSFGYAVAYRVARGAALRAWYEAVCAALRPVGLLPQHTWAETAPHLHAVRQLAEPAARLDRAPDGARPLAFRAARLVMSQRVGDGFRTWYDRPLDGAS